MIFTRLDFCIACENVDTRNGNLDVVCAVCRTLHSMKDRHGIIVVSMMGVIDTVQYLQSMYVQLRGNDVEFCCYMRQISGKVPGCLLHHADACLEHKYFHARDGMPCRRR